MKLENLINNQKFESLDLDLKPISCDQFNKEIDQSLNDAAQGRITTAKDLKSRIKEWS